VSAVYLDPHRIAEADRELFAGTVDRDGGRLLAGLGCDLRRQLEVAVIGAQVAVERAGI
jgi:hypothetical protein